MTASKSLDARRTWTDRKQIFQLERQVLFACHCKEQEYGKLEVFKKSNYSVCGYPVFGETHAGVIQNM